MRTVRDALTGAASPSSADTVMTVSAFEPGATRFSVGTKLSAATLVVAAAALPVKV